MERFTGMTIALFLVWRYVSFGESAQDMPRPSLLVLTGPQETPHAST